MTAVSSLNLEFTGVLQSLSIGSLPTTASGERLCIFKIFCRTVILTASKQLTSGAPMIYSYALGIGSLCKLCRLCSSGIAVVAPPIRHFCTDDQTGRLIASPFKGLTWKPLNQHLEHKRSQDLNERGRNYTCHACPMQEVPVAPQWILDRCNRNEDTKKERAATRLPAK